MWYITHPSLVRLYDSLVLCLESCRLTSSLRRTSLRGVMRRLVITALRSQQASPATQSQTVSSDAQTKKESSCSSSSGNISTLDHLWRFLLFFTDLFILNAKNIIILIIKFCFMIHITLTELGNCLELIRIAAHCFHVLTKNKYKYS